ncbi:hypothetical protein CKO35_02780 [Ectothiorhodospira shaposhnikovii]|uniref:hypothetical protein n=1 Tax=Ectothiorhodospira shaposhnikovii TaxID=1054 RepID=UPI0019075059|nr:hypothetical protein [Ectothiorhodospira shaposhnikovii]MBK1672242.1 hypothetical protein [Ectothiorhodospira shaposhnikovii]
MRTFRLLAGLSLFGLFFCAAAPAHSELPLTVEELITAKKKIRLDLSLSYANTDSKHLSTGDPILIQIGPTAFITLPGIVSENTWNMDTLAGSIGLRHGLTGDTEIYARSTFIKHWYRHDNGETSSSHSESRFADAWMGLNHRPPIQMGWSAQLAVVQQLDFITQ